MRRDERLLQLAVDGRDKSAIRIYRWEEPTVTVGYFQKSLVESGRAAIQIQGLDSRLADCPRVIRLSGGGAILHDHEITYSCTLPSQHPVRSNPLKLYEIVHRAIIGILKDCGVHAQLREEFNQSSQDATDRAAEPFLCFLRADPRDIVVDGVKILGSAQRRRKGCILQHGSLLLRASTLTPELPGLLDLAPAVDVTQLELRLPTAIASSVADDWSISNWSEH